LTSAQLTRRITPIVSLSILYIKVPGDGPGDSYFVHYLVNLASQLPELLVVSSGFSWDDLVVAAPKDFNPPHHCLVVLVLNLIVLTARKHVGRVIRWKNGRDSRHHDRELDRFIVAPTR